MAPPDTAAVVLAAGEASRFAGPAHKLDAEIDGRSLLRRAVDAAVASAIGPVIVVVAPADGGRDRAPRTSVPAGVITVANPDWRRGSASSLRAGLDAAAARGATRAVIALGDQPFISADAWRRVAAADSPVAVATYDGVRGHPVLLAAEVWGLVPASGDDGGRVVMRLRPALVAEIPCEGSPVDIDTVEDLRRWQNCS